MPTGGAWTYWAGEGGVGRAGRSIPDSDLANLVITVQISVRSMADTDKFQPLYPEERVLAPLLELGSQLVAECHRLGGQAGAPLVRALRPKLRAMNSYYSNKIEGQHTKPAAIERALHQQFDADVAMAGKQRVAVAHMAVEEQLDQNQTGRPAKDLFDPALVREIHG